MLLRTNGYESGMWLWTIRIRVGSVRYGSSEDWQRSGMVLWMIEA
jgi:hypothetical protein